MAVFTIHEIRNRSARAKAMQYNATASVILNEAIDRQNVVTGIDIFMSHSFTDADLVLGAKLKIEDYGYSVYVDWINDPTLDRRNVTAATAAKLRQRMDACKCLFYATTPHTSDSKWMPWECGYIDGQKGRVAILPLLEQATESYAGAEYLGVYPYVSDGTLANTTVSKLWIHTSSSIYCQFDAWLKGSNPSLHS